MRCALHCAMVLDMAKHTPDLIGSAEACRILRVNNSTLTRWVAAESVKAAHKLPGKNGAYLFERADIERLAVERAEQPA